MKIGGLLKFTLIDYPGKIAAVVFTQGCNLRCPYCHNSELVLPEKFNPAILEKEVFDLLKKRQGQLNGVVITGGEPTIHNDLPEFVKKIKQLGYSVKLDTNGTNPDMIKGLINEKLVDYIAIDIKAPFEKYKDICGVDVDIVPIKESIKIIMSSNVEYEFRTTLVKQFLSQEDLIKIKSYIKGAKKFIIQRFVPRGNVLNDAFKDESIDNYTEEEIKKLGYIDMLEERKDLNDIKSGASEPTVTYQKMLEEMDLEDEV